MARRFIEGSTDEDWALAANEDIDSSLGQSPPRFAREATRADESSLIIHRSMNQSFPLYGTHGSFRGQQSSVANLSSSVSIAPGTTLQMQHNHEAVSAVSQSNFYGLMTPQTDEVVRLKKQVSRGCQHLITCSHELLQLRQKESDWGKERAILEQRCQQAELSFKDLQMRMEQQKSMHDQMVKYLRQNDSALTVDVTKSISEATQSAVVMRLESEIASQRLEHRQREKDLAGQIEEQNSQISDLLKEKD